MVLPGEIQLKIDKVRTLFYEEIQKQIIIRKQKQIEEEKRDIPSFTKALVDWAVNKGLTKITKGDTDLLPTEKNISLLGHTSLEVVKMYVNLITSDILDQHRKFSPVDNTIFARKEN